MFMHSFEPDSKRNFRQNLFGELILALAPRSSSRRPRVQGPSSRRDGPLDSSRGARAFRCGLSCFHPLPVSVFMAWLFILLADVFGITWPFVLKWSVALSRWSPVFVAGFFIPALV